MPLPPKRVLGGLAVGAFLLSLGAIALYVRHGVKVRVHNSGMEPLRGVVVHVTGNSYPLGDMPTGSTVSIRVVAKGESHVEVEFRDSKGVSKRLKLGCYFEGDPYRGTISVDLDSEKILHVSDSVTIGF
jgi:hypothetical protein